MKINLLFIFVFGVLLNANSSEKPAIHLTGNTTIDFLGSSVMGRLTLDSNRTVSHILQITESENEEKSPWLAGLFSFAVPGAGEIYSKSYVKGAIFLGVEIGAWITSIIYNKKGDNQTKLFEDYANAHYSVVRYGEWVLDDLSSLNVSLDRSAYEKKIFETYPPDPNCPPPFVCVNWAELNDLEGKISSFTHKLPFYGQQQYYELIGKYKQFSKGWDSQDPILHPEEYARNHLEGNSQFFSYGEMFNKADKYYKVADALISVIVVNHILSALDAAWTASRYNRALHASVKVRMDETPYGYLPAAEAYFSYSF